ncbi:acyl-CoA dehydrogenase family protein [Mycolicibacterium sp. CBMA 226]|uniref:acyl-CoA dehydrogenase family protein n=1 Tax=Mycolicibacterium sp. CBMA 226 TaxID=2606611 RepID=UPI00130762FA|nr:acyl-CoA dehydrogenase family protein [Mycolicibacterium sp. CBMA 226]MUL74505.1 acyl-CoA dehydrogenase [Mycolicibacterium sp. CBMA 226]
MTNDPSRLISDQVDALLRDHPPGDVSPRQFWGAQFDAGLAFVRFPEGLGGLGIDHRYQQQVDSRLADAGAPTDNRDLNLIGLALTAPALIEHAAPDVQRRLLRPLYTAEEVWCQLFSEPGAGSDLAGLSATAVRDGDEWVLNGQKVWTTLAHKARWGQILVRTDPDAPKHRGLTCFILDMTAPGIEVRPIYEITGEAEFNEVFLNDVRVPDAMMLGELNRGWAVAVTILMNERFAAGRSIGPRGSGVIENAVVNWRKFAHQDAVLRDQLVKYWIDAEVLRLTEIRASHSAGRGTPGPEGSVAKLRWAQLNQSITSFALDLLGAEAMHYPDGYEFIRPEWSQVASGSTQKMFLRSRANSIEGGTNEIMRNILATRVLQLPEEPRSDRDVPWRSIPRG